MGGRMALRESFDLVVLEYVYGPGVRVANESVDDPHSVFAVPQAYEAQTVPVAAFHSQVWWQRTAAQRRDNLVPDAVICHERIAKADDQGSPASRHQVYPRRLGSCPTQRREYETLRREGRKEAHKSNELKLCALCVLAFPLRYIAF